jgi:hypothetical protein
MYKKSTIKNLLVIPFIASAVFLASPAFANDSQVKNKQTQVSKVHDSTAFFRNKKNHRVLGTVTSTSGGIIVLTSEDGATYTIDATHATVMKANTNNTNPAIVDVSNIKVGDTIVVKGNIDGSAVAATNIFDGKMPMKHWKGKMGHRK